MQVVCEVGDMYKSKRQQPNMIKVYKIKIIVNQMLMNQQSKGIHNDMIRSYLYLVLQLEFEKKEDTLALTVYT